MGLLTFEFGLGSADEGIDGLPIVFAVIEMVSQVPLRQRARLRSFIKKPFVRSVGQWREGEDLLTSGWVRATAPSGDATFEGVVGWSGELGYGERSPEPTQSVRDGGDH